MRTLVLLLALFFTINSQAAPVQAWLLLGTNERGVTQSVDGDVVLALLDPRQPSCQVMQMRLDYARKQVDEVKSLIDNAEKAHNAIDPQTETELQSLENRWLQLQKLLTEPWATATVHFPYQASSDTLREKMVGNNYQLTADILGRHWQALKNELPDGWVFQYDTNQLAFVLTMTWSMQQYCSSMGGVIELQLAY